ncbi:MAG TPA: 3-methyl-2-oxobutanoate hydroxymethyltransferase [Syntrophales bacterium]|nr:3-methyl-2-oxobutanoate hydroxymethyltransferase [Syntrophales bacterium]
MSTQTTTNRITTAVIRNMKGKKEKICMLTAYDYPTALILDEAGIDIVLVGDTLGMVVLGYDSTLPVTMDEMIHHTKAVSRAVKHAMVVGDMPFMSYQVSSQDALYNAGRFLQEAGAQGIKLEGGREVAETIRRMTSAGIPVMAHLGLTPQSVHQFGGFKVQGKDERAALRIMEDAKILEEAGAFSIVLECVPAELAKTVTQSINIPTIGIGAGVDCDGQVLVLHDTMGMFEKFIPKFVKIYAQLNVQMKQAVSQYIDDVRKGTFPEKKHSF